MQQQKKGSQSAVSVATTTRKIQQRKGKGSSHKDLPSSHISNTSTPVTPVQPLPPSHVSHPPTPVTHARHYLPPMSLTLLFQSPMHSHYLPPPCLSPFYSSHPCAATTSLPCLSPSYSSHPCADAPSLPRSLSSCDQATYYLQSSYHSGIIFSLFPYYILRT